MTVSLISGTPHGGVSLYMPYNIMGSHKEGVVMNLEADMREGERWGLEVKLFFSSCVMVSQTIASFLLLY